MIQRSNATRSNKAYKVGYRLGHLATNVDKVGEGEDSIGAWKVASGRSWDLWDTWDLWQLVRLSDPVGHL